MNERLEESKTVEMIRSAFRYAHWRLKGSPPPPLALEIATVDEWIESYARLRPEQSERNAVSISVVMPLGGSTIEMVRRSIDSLESQTHQEWELLLIGEDIESPGTTGIGAELGLSDHRVRRARSPSGQGVAAQIGAGVDAASGEYVTFVSPGDRIAASALEWIATCIPTADLIYTDDVRVSEDDSFESAFFKPAWSPRLLFSFAYADHLVCVRRSLISDVGGIRPGTDAGPIHDLLLRISDVDVLVAHIPILASFRRYTPPSGDGGVRVDAAKIASQQRILEQAVERKHLQASVILARELPRSQVVFDRVLPKPTVKIVMPTRDRLSLLQTAVDGVLHHTEGVETHLVIVDNGTVEEDAVRYLDELDKARANVSVARVDAPFNFSMLSNVGAAEGADTPYLLFLNNDVQILHTGWLLQLIGWLRDDPDVVGVGTKLLYPDGRIQHAGVILGFGGFSGHYAAHKPNRPTQDSLHDAAREIGCLTAACMAVRSDDFRRVGGFDEELPIDFQDVDLCLRLRTQLGGVLVYDPTYPLVHRESASRGSNPSSDDTLARMRLKWGDVLAHDDPYYSPHLSLNRLDLSLREVPNDEAMMHRRLRPRWFEPSSVTLTEDLGGANEWTGQ